MDGFQKHKYKLQEQVGLLLDHNIYDIFAV